MEMWRPIIEIIVSLVREVILAVARREAEQLAEKWRGSGNGKVFAESERRASADDTA